MLLNKNAPGGARREFMLKDESSWLAVAGHIYMWIFFFFGDAALFYACISISYLVWLDADTWPLYIGSFFISLILVFFIALLTICMCHIVDIFINLFSIMRSRTGQGTQGRKKRLLRDRLLEYLRSVLPLSIFDSPGLPLFLDYPEEKKYLRILLCINLTSAAKNICCVIYAK